MSRVNTNYVSEMEELKKKVRDLEEDRETLSMKLRDRDLRVEELRDEIKKVRSERNALLIAVRDNQEQEKRRNEVVALPDKVEEEIASETSEEEEEEEEPDTVSTQQRTDRVRYIRRRVLNVEEESKEHEDRRLDIRSPKIQNRSPTKTRSHTEQDERENQIESTMRALDELEALSVDLLSDD